MNTSLYDPKSGEKFFTDTLTPTKIMTTFRSSTWTKWDVNELRFISESWHTADPLQQVWHKWQKFPWNKHDWGDTSHKSKIVNANLFRHSRHPPSRILGETDECNP